VIDVGDTRLGVINLKLSRNRRAAERQMEALLHESWVAEASGRLPVVFCLDAGAPLSPRIQGLMEQRFGEIRRQQPEGASMARRGMLYAPAGMNVIHVEGPVDDLISEAGESRPLVIEIDFSENGPPDQETSRSC
jgi:hypothetical protein